MHQNPDARVMLLVASLLMVACTLSLLRAPIPEPAQSLLATNAPPSPVTDTPNAASTVATPPAAETHLPKAPSSPAAFCDDPRPLLLIEAFKKAISTADGGLLSSLVSPEHGMDARLLRDGRVVNYDREHAAALFESTYVVDWGNAAGSGLPIKAAFRDVFVPDLEDVLSKPYTAKCNQIQAGGTTYSIQWPYNGIDYYSLYYAGSAGSGRLDWHTWVIGMHVVDDEAYLYAITQFRWEP